MPRTTIDPDDDDFDAQVRAARSRNDLFAQVDDDPEPTVTTPKAATPAPLPSGGNPPPSAPPSAEEILRGAIRTAKGEGRPRGGMARYVDEGNGSSVGFRIN